MIEVVARLCKIIFNQIGHLDILIETITDDLAMRDVRFDCAMMPA